MKSLQEIFPRSSKSFQDINSAILTLPADKNSLAVKPGGKKRGSMNKTEAEFALILESDKRSGYINDWKFEGITLFWGDGMRYTADFAVHAEYAHEIPAK